MKKWPLSVCFLAVLLSAVACGSSELPPAPESNDGSVTAPSSDSESQPEEQSSAPAYDIPEPELPAVDFGGESFQLYCGTVGLAGNLTRLGTLGDEYLLFPAESFLSSEVLTGEVVNDAVFNRNLAVEERFNLKIRIVESELRADQLVQAGERLDLVMESGSILAETASTGAFYNLLDFPYINLEAEYWSPRCLEGTIVDNLVYVMPNDICLDPLVHTGILYFNKRILAENDLESPYDMVHNNTWTLDNFLNLVRSVHKDLNGDGKMDLDDLYGGAFRIEWRMGAFMQFYYGAGQTYSKVDEEQGRVLAFNGEIVQSIIDRLSEVIDDNSICIDNADVEKLNGDNATYDSMFLEGKALFIQHFITSTDVFREMEDDFGIVPNPKYDTQQDRYYQKVDVGSGMFSIPVTTASDEQTGAITEYMAWLSHCTVLPAYYEITIKTKRVRDEEAVEMLDIIRNSRVFEFADLYYTTIPHYVWDSYTARSFANKVGASEKLLKKRLATYVSKVRRIE
ncbi:MAG: carbohydrate ABC transporter substrate-binding protein [Clostridia bacterium]|nr:carbohydrate ABC transporter substrate-binding protein [Clostridia bacterium]